MRKHLSLLFSAFLLVSVASWAQSDSPGTSNANAGKSAQSAATAQEDQNAAATAAASGKNEQQLEGCIVRERNDYYLEPVSGQEVRLHGQNIGEHVNHHVQVHGTQMNASNTTGTAGAVGGAAASAAGTPQEFLVSRVDMISESCPANLQHRQSGNPGVQNQSPQ